MIEMRRATNMTVGKIDFKTGDQVRASHPYGGVPACCGNIVSELILGARTQFLVKFEVRPHVFKKFYLTERELTLCVAPEAYESSPHKSSPQSG
jgi:hypothetical protein